MKNFVAFGGLVLLISIGVVSCKANQKNATTAVSTQALTTSTQACDTPSDSVLDEGACSVPLKTAPTVPSATVPPNMSTPATTATTSSPEPKASTHH
ncbi:MAG TPA: hypothetical protein VF412_15205 [Bdellovibrio sp.]|uniref:hypothetical protein n=1 Tax=Bdellovibrio sp. TaxID=28201 RepID=UPI002EEF1895